MAMDHSYVQVYRSATSWLTSQARNIRAQGALSKATGHPQPATGMVVSVRLLGDDRHHLRLKL